MVLASIAYLLQDIQNLLFPLMSIVQLITILLLFWSINILSNPNTISITEKSISTGKFRDILWEELDWENSSFKANRIVLKNKKYPHKNFIRLYPKFYTLDIEQEILKNKA